MRLESGNRVAPIGRPAAAALARQADHRFGKARDRRDRIVERHGRARRDIFRANRIGLRFLVRLRRSYRVTAIEKLESDDEPQQREGSCLHNSEIFAFVFFQRPPLTQGGPDLRRKPQYEERNQEEKAWDSSPCVLAPPLLPAPAHLHQNCHTKILTPRAARHPGDSNCGVKPLGVSSGTMGRPAAFPAAVRKPGNPNWGRPIPPAPVLATEFGIASPAPTPRRRRVCRLN